jgi:hypothetical protein
MKDKDRKKFIATCNKGLIHCICECTRNPLKGHLPLKKCHFKSLSRHKHLLRKLSLKKTALNQRKKILQKGRFLALLIPTLVSASVLSTPLRFGGGEIGIVGGTPWRARGARAYQGETLGGNSVVLGGGGESSPLTGLDKSLVSALKGLVGIFDYQWKPLNEWSWRTNEF